MKPQRHDHPVLNCHIDIDHDSAQAALDWSDLIDRAASATLAALPDLTAVVPEFSVLVCDDEAIRQLNTDYRGKDKPTNVLSFPQFEPFAIPDGEQYIGDIAVSFDTLLREAQEGNISLHDHAMHLMVHSLLHLCGYDHMDDAEAEAMEAMEAAILATMGIKNPYAEELM